MYLIVDDMYMGQGMTWSISLTLVMLLESHCMLHFSRVRYRPLHAIDFGDIAMAGVSIDLIYSSKAPGIFSGSLV
jgi:hypothetical protein